MPKSDFTKDPSLSFLYVLKEAGALPEYVNEVPEEEDLKNLPDVVFADVSNRLFPVHDKQATFLSAVDAFVKGCTHDSDPWLSRLKTACQAQEIEADVLRAHETLELKTAGEESLLQNKDEDKQVKEASAGRPTHALELVVTPEKGAEKFYPIGNEAEIGLSADKIASDILEGKLPLSWHSDACETLLKAASDMGMDSKFLPKSVVKFGRRFMPSRSVLDSEIEKRAAENASEELLEVYKQAADLALSNDISPNEGALVWQAADKKAGFDHKFSGDEDPIWAFKSGLPVEVFDKVKEAHFRLGVVTLPKSKLDKVADDLIARRLQQEDARLAIHAKKASTGTEASTMLEGLSETAVQKLSEMIINAEQENGMG